MFTSVQSRFSSYFFLVVLTSESGNLTYMKNIYFLSSLERPMETSWRNTTSRHRDNVHVCDKRPVWGYLLVDQPTSTCFKWHTSITVYLQRTSGCSNSHERRCGTQNLWKGYESKSTLEMNVYEIFFSDFQCNKYFTLFLRRFCMKMRPRPRTSSRCYHGNKSAATLKKGMFGHPPWVPNCMQNLKGGWKFSFPKMFDSCRLVLNKTFAQRLRAIFQFCALS